MDNILKKVIEFYFERIFFFPPPFSSFFDVFLVKKHGVQGANNSPFRKTEQKVQQNMGYGSHSGGSTSKSSSHTGTKRK